MISSSSPSIVILGAGMSGLCMAIQLKKAGIESFTIIEKGNGIGGTWWFNTYPGAQCDVHSYLYAFSFEPYLEWTKKFAPQHEIQKYLEHCVDKYDLRKHIQLNTEIISAQFQELTGQWVIKTKDKKNISANFFVCSSGPLDIPNYPNIAGLENFKGTLFHSARWDHHYQYANKRIAVIGNAASAVQFIPELVNSAKEVFVFQRTPNWILPRPDKPYSFIQKNLLRLPLVARSYRYVLYTLHELFRLALNQGSLMSKLITKVALKHLRQEIQNPHLRTYLTPQYPLGCKRVLMSNKYYACLNRSNVRLITSNINNINEYSIQTEDHQSLNVDAIILATGFKATQMLGSIDIEGLNGITLKTLWNDFPKAYYGITLPHLPNFFLLLGPNTGQGHTSTLIYIEAQVGYILKIIKKLMKHQNGDYVVLKTNAMETHNKALQQKLKGTIWAQQCNSWYKTSNGDIAAIHPGFSFQYIHELYHPKFEDYLFGNKNLN